MKMQNGMEISSASKHQTTIVDPIEHPDWIIEGWRIKFILSEKQLGQVRQQSKLSNWYEDPTVRDTWIERISICLYSIEKFYKTFGVLPQVGDRLFDEATGTVIQERSIDGYLMTITFTLSN